MRLPEPTCAPISVSPSSHNGSPPLNGAPKLALVQGEPPIEDPMVPATLPALLRQVAAEVTGPQIIYVQANGVESTQSYAELLDEAERILAGLRQHGLQPQAKVILQLKQNQDILPAFWGCLLGGFIPIITATPPTYEQANNDLERLKQVWRQLEQPTMLTDRPADNVLADLAHWFAITSEQIVTIDTLRDYTPDLRHYPTRPADVAFFSLTSGSTGAPKCIPLTHRSVLARVRAANHYCGQTQSIVTLNWLPLEHIGPLSDMHLRAVALGCQQIHAPRGYVAGNPLNWLTLLDHYRATYSASPNFAYALINNALEKTQGAWDLSCVETLLSAGEVVSPQTVRSFIEKLMPYGLKPTVVQPCFGMAEMGSGVTYFRATLARPYQFFWVGRTSLAGAVALLAPGDPNSVGLTSLGSIIPGLAMRIVDAEQRVLPEGTVGRFQVKGAAVTAGYYHSPHLSEQVSMNNEMANQETFSADGWFDTGDLGFILHNELVLTGRAKESIIINGVNYANLEIEAAVETVAGSGDGPERSYTVACAVHMPGRDHEELAIFFVPDEQAKRDLPALLMRIRHTVVQKIGVLPHYLIPVARTEMPKTAIGKLQRIKLAKRLEAGEFADRLQHSAPHIDQARPVRPPGTLLERRLAQIWQEVLEIPQVGIDDNFFALGGASLQAASLITRLQEELQDTFHVVAIFNAPTIAELATYLEEQYPLTIARMLGQPVNGDRPQPHAPITAADVAEVRRRLPVIPPLHRTPTTKNPPVIFVLSAARSGSTMFRVMLAGHPQLFAPPELLLLGYETVAEREAALTGERRSWREGVLKAITQLYDWSPSQAEQWLAQMAKQEATVQELYGHLQQALVDTPTPRSLVEKTPQDTLNLDILRRAELYFDQPRYIHLTRHPGAATRSFEEARLDQLMYALMPGLQGAPGARKFSTAALAEITWLISQQNILRFLQEIPPQRQIRVQYEALVKAPRQQMEALCHFLGLDFAEGMVQPYQEKAQRMTTGLYAKSRMIGDVKFHQHTTIDATVADRWQAAKTNNALGAVTWAMAEQLGYERPQMARAETSLQSPVSPRLGSSARDPTQRRGCVYFVFTMLAAARPCSNGGPLICRLTLNSAPCNCQGVPIG